jgi:hypothetical protein
MNIKRALTWLTAVGGTITGATINNSTIGVTTPVAGNFTTIGATTPAAVYASPAINKGPAIITTFAGTVTAAASTTVTFSSAADALLAGYSATNPVLGTTLISNALTRYIVSWTNSTTCVVDAAVTWAGTAITSVQSVTSAGVLKEATFADGTKYIAGNVGIGTTTFGTSAAKVLAMGAGTAPTTSPADAAQIWVADTGAVAGKAAISMRDEAGNSGPVAFANVLVATRADADGTLGLDEMYGKTHICGFARTYTLPAAAVGMSATFRVTAAVAVSVKAGVSDALILGTSHLDNGDKATSDASIYATIYMECTVANHWDCYPALGLWIDGGA